MGAHASSPLIVNGERVQSEKTGEAQWQQHRDSANSQMASDTARRHNFLTLSTKDNAVDSNRGQVMYRVSTSLRPVQRGLDSNLRGQSISSMTREGKTDSNTAWNTKSTHQRSKSAQRNGQDSTLPHAARSRSVSPSRRKVSFQLRTPLSSKDIETLKHAVRAVRSSSTTKVPSPKLSSQNSQDKGTMASLRGRLPSHSLGSPISSACFKSISAVNDHLYICGAMALTEDRVKALNITCVINATLEWPALNIPGLETMRVRLDDVPSSNLYPYFDPVADKIKEVASRGGRTLVHCMAGVSRSSSLCIAYLMKYKGRTLPEALSLMRARRSIIRPNDGFWRQLIQYEKQLRKNKTHKKPAGDKYMTRFF